MRRIILYCLILGAVLIIPVERLDVGKLEPVQAVWAYTQKGNIILETDTQDRGSGETVEQALADLKAHCLGIIYLDTAQFLLVSEDAQNQIPELRKHLKGSVRLCQWDGQGSVSDGAKYMAAHKIGYELKDWSENTELPNLQLRTSSKKDEKTS